MLAIILGIATTAVVFAAEKGLDNYICARKAAARCRYDADEFEDDDDIFCEETTPPPQERYHGRVCPDLFGRIQRVQDERLNESIRQGQELEELQKPDIFRNIREESDNHEETFIDVPEDVIDHVFKDVNPQDEPAEEPQEESTEEEKPAEEETPAPERDEKGRFIKKK